MSTLIRTQLLASLRSEVKDLDDKIERAELHIGSFESRFFSRPHGLGDQARAELRALHEERDAIIAKIEEAEEADDLMWSLVCAIQDAYDGEPLTVGSLQAQLENYGLVVSRKPATIIETEHSAVGGESALTLKDTRSLAEQRASFKRLRSTIAGWRGKP
jgi:hypothetical protein